MKFDGFLVYVAFMCIISYVLWWLYKTGVGYVLVSKLYTVMKVLLDIQSRTECSVLLHVTPVSFTLAMAAGSTRMLTMLKYKSFEVDDGACTS